MKGESLIGLFRVITDQQDWIESNEYILIDGNPLCILKKKKEILRRSEIERSCFSSFFCEVVYNEKLR